MSNWKKIDFEHWERKEHYRYYTEFLKIQFNMTADIRVEKLLAYCHVSGKRFYPVFIYLVAKTLNSMENFKLFTDEDGNVCIWDSINPNYTIFHDDDKTFSDCWSEYSESLEEFYEKIIADMETYRDVKGIKARPDQPANFFCISMVPWVSFSSFNSRAAGGFLQYFPIITAGKYRKVNEEVLMPVNLNIAHAVCDGYHAGLFFETLQKEIDKL